MLVPVCEWRRGCHVLTLTDEGVVVGQEIRSLQHAVQLKLGLVRRLGRHCNCRCIRTWEEKNTRVSREEETRQSVCMCHDLRINCPGTCFQAFPEADSKTGRAFCFVLV